MILSVAIQLAGRMRRHLGAVIDDGTRLLGLHHLVGERRVEDGGVDVAGEQVGHQPAAAQRHAGEVDLACGHRPQGEDVRARARRGDADLLAGEILDLGHLGLGLHDQVPAVIAVRAVGDAFDVDALPDPGRDARRGVQDQVGGAGGHGLEAFGAAAIDRELGVDAFLVEQLVAQRRLADDRRPIGLGRHADPDLLACLCDGEARQACGRSRAGQHGAA